MRGWGVVVKLCVLQPSAVAPHHDLSCKDTEFMPYFSSFRLL